jgi:maltose alpha-D-glucosyltransferase/alpha-amylase
LLTLTPHAAFWFSLEPAAASISQVRTGPPESLTVPESWEEIFNLDLRPQLENILCNFVKSQPWFRGFPRQIKSVQIRDVIELSRGSSKSFLLFLLVEFMEGDPEDYLLPIAISRQEPAMQPEGTPSPDIIAHLCLEATEEKGILCAGAGNKAFGKALMDFVRRRRLSVGQEGELRGFASGVLRNGVGDGDATFEPVFRPAGINNIVAVFGDTFLLKLFARLEPGTNPELEFGRFLTEHHFPNVPPVAGYLEYRRQNGERFDLAIVTRFLPSAQDTWGYTLDMLGRYFDRIRTVPAEKRGESAPKSSLLQLAAEDVPEAVVAQIGTYLELARLLGQRAAEMHLALAADPRDREFAPEPFSPFYQRALYQSMRNLTAENLQLLRDNFGTLPEIIHADARKVLSLEKEILKRLRAVSESPLQAQRIRCHCDFHLGQVLYTGKDFMFLDFQAGTSRSFGERRIRRSPLRDVAGMLRSFDYVTNVALWKQRELGVTQEEQQTQLQPWADFWCRWVSAVFLKAYLRVVAAGQLIPSAREQLNVLLEVHLLEKGLTELGFEIRKRPEWVKIPLRSIVRLIESGNAL